VDVGGKLQDPRVFVSFLSLTKKKSCLPEEALILNAVAMVLTASYIVVAYIIMKDDFTCQDIS
jgi:hypothetical protein